MRRAPSTTGSTAAGIPTSAQAANRGLVTNSIASAPAAVMVLRRAIDITLPTMLRISSTSAVSRETSSPLRVRSWKPASRLMRCAYNWVRRSATTRSPSRETKKKRAAVATASATATTNSSRKARSMSPALPLRNPSSIIVRNATGRLSEAAEDSASAHSQAPNRPRWRRTKGHSARREPMGALAGAGVGESMRAW